MAREKHVYGHPGIAHAFAHQTVSWARASDGRMFYDGDNESGTRKWKRIATMYSYGHHYPAATLYDLPLKRVDGGPSSAEYRVCLLNSRSYSTSTSKHMSYIRYAVNHLTCFNVPNTRDPAAPENKTRFVDEIARLWKHANNPKARHITSDLDQIPALVHSAEKFSKMFKLGWKIKAPPVETLYGRRNELETKERLRTAMLEERRAAKDRNFLLGNLSGFRADIEAQMRWPIDRLRGLPEWTAEDESLVVERQAREITKWRADGRDGWGLDGTYLRVRGDTVCTSKGAEFPLAHGLKAWPVIKRCHDTKTPWFTNGHTVHLGAYKIDQITETGDVRAGCHLVPFTEVERLAKELGL